MRKTDFALLVIKAEYESFTIYKHTHTMQECIILHPCALKMNDFLCLSCKQTRHAQGNSLHFKSKGRERAALFPHACTLISALTQSLNADTLQISNMLEHFFYYYYVSLSPLFIYNLLICLIML